MKLVPTLERLLENRDYEIVICIDDDLLLDPNMVTAYKRFYAQETPCVSSQRVLKFNENPNIQYILGVHTIAFHSSVVTKELVQDLKKFNAQKECRMHDDVALIMALHKHKVPIKKGPDFFRECTPDSFSTDALWHREPHSIKDARCYKSLVEYI